MKARISSEALLKALSTFIKIIPTRPALDIYGCAVLDLRGGELICSFTDGEILVRTTVTVTEAIEEGICAVRANILDLIRTLPKEDVTLCTDGNSVIISWSTGETSVPAFSTADFPDVRDVEDPASVMVLPAITLASALEKTMNEVSTDDSRPAMCGVYFDTSEGNLNMVASDRFHLVVVNNPTVAASGLKPFILGKKAASLLKSLCEKNPADAAVTRDDRKVSFSIGNTKVITPLLTHNYVRYKDVFPTDLSKVFKAERTEFQSVLKRMLSATPGNKRIIMEMSEENGIIVTSKDIANGVNARDRVSGSYVGEPMTACFNISNLLAIVNLLASPSLELRMVAPNRAALLVPSWDDGKDIPTEIFKGLVMPVQA